ncbi:protein FAM173B isoform X1 [Cynoglossus semilaevis]|uniref:Si:dkey-190g11.3 n=1 Tax=Cynoglossus semilaevis TaxID=244447 RepID=A0A3P8WJH1_CYNSE|nr:protein FAM173B-like isoform X1 [Cynoglossus semilaevis]
MENTIEVILQDHSSTLLNSKSQPVVTACTGALFTAMYGLWGLFTVPVFRKIPWRLKLLEGRGRLADLGSGDGRLVFAAAFAGFQCTGFEINSLLVIYSTSKATFLEENLWKTDLSSYNNVTAFLAPGVMEVLGEKLLKELPDDACVTACRFPLPNWLQRSSVGSGLDETFAYDISTVRSQLGNVQVKMV